MKHTAKLALAALLVAGGTSVNALHAGEVMIAPLPPPAESSFPFYGSIEAGYESSYIFRGTNLGDHAPWAGIDMNYDFTEAVSLNFGVWYINPTSNPTASDELDLYAFVNFPVGPLELSVGGTGFFFPEAGGNTGEIGLAVGLPLGDIFSIGGAFWYDFEANVVSGGGGGYGEVNLGAEFPVNDWLTLGVTTGVSYGSTYYGVSGWNNAFVRASLSIALTETLSLNGYVGGNFPFSELEAFTGQDDEIHGGVSMAVSF